MVIHTTERPAKLLQKAAIISLVVGALLLVVKFAAYAMTGSAAILSDAVESIVNIVTAAFAVYSIGVSLQPADEDHPYGHGKIEFFSAALEGGAIVVAAVWIIYKAVSELVGGAVIHRLDMGLILVALAAGVNGLLGWYLLKIGKMEGSLILEADARHVLTDVLTSVGVVIGLFVVYFTRWIFLDAIIAIVVAVNIIFTGWKLLRKALGGMMDATTIEDTAAILEILEKTSFPDVCAYHKLRHRKSGVLHFVDFHLIFRRGLPIEQAHAIATAIEAQIAASFGDASVMAHIEPCREKDCPNCREKRG